jgi:hypothetical protein
LIRLRVGKCIHGVIGVGLVAWSLVVSGGADVWAEEIHGPLALRNQSPIQLLFFQFVPERAMPLDYNQVLLRLDIAETNTLTAGTGRGGRTRPPDNEM